MILLLDDIDKSAQYITSPMRGGMVEENQIHIHVILHVMDDICDHCPQYVDTVCDNLDFYLNDIIQDLITSINVEEYFSR